MVDPSRLDDYVRADVRCELLQLIRSPDFYSALMRSAAKVKPDAQA